jgi:hypothetical protein
VKDAVKFVKDPVITAIGAELYVAAVISNVEFTLLPPAAVATLTTCGSTVKEMSEHWLAKVLLTPTGLALIVTAYVNGAPWQLSATPNGVIV